MAISFGRGKRPADAADAPFAMAINGHLLKYAASAADKHITCALEVVDRRSGGRAHLYLFDGGIYSIAVEGYVPDVAARLQASGALDEERAERLRGEERPGVAAVERGWVSVDALGTTHQEYLLASFGAILACDRLRVSVLKGEVTDAFCTLPLPIDPLVESVRVRAQRLATSWQALAVDSAPDSTVLQATGSPVPSALSLPEYPALVAAVDGNRSLDAVAEQVGLTRAEAVHLVGMLISAGALTATAGPAELPPADHYLVPEAFGTVELAPLVEAAAAETPTGPVAVAAVAEPDVELSAEPVAERDAESGELPEVVLVPDLDDVGDDSSDDHVRMLRQELAAAEIAELEVALVEAVALEREAISRTAALRARLRDAQAALDAAEPHSGDRDVASEPGRA